MNKPVVTSFNHNKATLKKDIEKAFDETNFKDIFKRDSKVFIKPNFTLPFYKPGVTTHEHIIEEVVNVLKNRVSEVYIGEADGGAESFTAKYSLENHGIPGMCKRTGAEMLNLSKIESTFVEETVIKKKVKVPLPKMLLNMDVSISMPVIKVHVAKGVSLSIKNLWGCHPNTMRLLDRKNLDYKLSLIARKINLKYSVIDGIYGLNRRGPMDGDVDYIGGIFIGNNPLSTDSVITKMIGFDPYKISHLKIAYDFGLGEINEEEINLIYSLDNYRRNYYLKPTFVDKVGTMTFENYLFTKMVFDSPFTKIIYKIARRTPRKKILKLGDEL